MQPTWITFDCFGTLVDWNTGFRRILQPFANGKTERMIAAYHHFERRFELMRPHQPYKDVVGLSLLAAAEKCDLRMTAEQAEHLLNNWRELPLFPDTEFMLDSLRALDCKLAVLTNCDNAMFNQTHRLFSKPFDAVLTAEVVRNYKPAHDHFRVFWRNSRADRRRWIHVGCSLYHDVYPAMEMKLKTVWLNREYSQELPPMATVLATTGTKVVHAIQSMLMTEEMSPAEP